MMVVDGMTKAHARKVRARLKQALRRLDGGRGWVPGRWGVTKRYDHKAEEYVTAYCAIGAITGGHAYPSRRNLDHDAVMVLAATIPPNQQPVYKGGLDRVIDYNDAMGRRPQTIIKKFEEAIGLLDERLAQPGRKTKEGK